MDKCFIPKNYQFQLSVCQTQCAISYLKELFQKQLCRALRLTRVSAPLFVEAASGFNDDLNGYERPVAFDVPDVGVNCQVVHSLAKWKRYALGRYQFEPGTGLLTDMNAIRRDETVDNLHSVYVDQWDWEKVITRQERNRDYLIRTAEQIVQAIYAVREKAAARYPQLTEHLPGQLLAVTAQELEDRFPNLPTARERETAFLREHPEEAVFLMGIGGPLRSGKPHDGRAPDYDDWTLNGDLLYWNETLQCSFEVSSMGIRVDAEALEAQLKQAGCEERRELPFHRALLNGELPLTIGGGIGQSRLCMLLLGCAHIGQVQCSVWDEATRRICEKAGVALL